MIDKNVHDNGQAKADEEISGVDAKIPGVDNAEEITEIDKAEETPGVDDKTPGTEDDHDNEAEPDRIEVNSIEHTSGRMKRPSRFSYTLVSPLVGGPIDLRNLHPCSLGHRL